MSGSPDLRAAPPQPAVRSGARPTCPMCGRPGKVLHRDLADLLFGASGLWSIRQCPGVRCGLLWLDPMPFEEDLPQLYRTYFTHDARGPTLGWRGRADHLVRRGVLQGRLGYARGLSRGMAALLSAVAALAPSGADGFLAEAMFLGAPIGGNRLLEVGCGNGDALAGMRDLGWSVLGTDFDPGAVTAARQLGLDVRLGGIECVGPVEGLFDAIYLGHVVEHVPDPAGLVRRCGDLLREGGRLVLVTPNTDGLGSRWFGRHWRGLEPPRHLHLFNPTNLATLCAGAGLDVRSVRASARGARYILGMSMWLAKVERGRRSPSEPGPWTRLAAAALQIVERSVGVLSPSAGEEIVLLAGRKSVPDA